MEAMEACTESIAENRGPGDVEQLWSKISEAITKTNNEVLGLKRVRKGRALPWLTAEVKVAIREKSQRYREYKSSPTNNRWLQ